MNSEGESSRLLNPRWCEHNVIKLRDCTIGVATFVRAKKLYSLTLGVWKKREKLTV